MAEVGAHVVVIHSAGNLDYLERLRPAGFTFTLVKKCATDEDRARFDRVVDFDYQTGVDAALALVDRLHAETPIDGVVSFSESGVAMAAIAAGHLGLPGHPAAAALRARDKYLMRCALRDAGLATPAFHLVDDAAQAFGILRSHGGPMVLKPISGSSSYGVTRLDPGDTEAQIEAHMADVRRYIAEYAERNPQYPFEFWLPGAGHGIDAGDVHDPRRQFLLEGFLPGRQVSVDGVVCDGRVTPCGVIEIERIKDADYFLEYEEWMPTRLGAAVEARVQDHVEAAVRALGLSHGAFHCELKVDGERACVLEIAARRGADNIADFLRRVMDVDIYEEAVRIACGQGRHRPRPAPRAHMKMRYFLPETAGQLVAIEGLDDVRADSRVSELDIEIAVGDEVLVPPDGFEFLGYVSVVADRADDADRALEEVHRRVRFVVAPTPIAPGTGADAISGAGVVPVAAGSPA